MQPGDEEEPKWRAEFEKLGRETVCALRSFAAKAFPPT
jgi:hypothetical protein